MAMAQTPPDEPPKSATPSSVSRKSARDAAQRPTMRSGRRRPAGNLRLLHEHDNNWKGHDGARGRDPAREGRQTYAVKSAVRPDLGADRFGRQKLPNKSGSKQSDGDARMISTKRTPALRIDVRNKDGDFRQVKKASTTASGSMTKLSIMASCPPLTRAPAALSADITK